MRPIIGGGTTKCFSKDRLDELTNILDTNDKSIFTSVLVVQDGKTVFEYGDVTKPTKLASCRKSILSMLYGIYNINLSQTLEELKIDDIGGLLPIEKTATINDLMNSLSGVYHPASNSGDDTEFAPERGSKKPGEFHLYNNWDFNALGTIFEQITRTNIYDAFEEKLAKPLGLQDFNKSGHEKTGDAEKSIHLAYHFHLSARDMAKLGQLMLNGGKYGTKQIIPNNWVKKTTTLVVPPRDFISQKRGRYGYGYMWWIADIDNKNDLWYGSFQASGKDGQRISILPKLNMIIIHKYVFPKKTDLKLKLVSLNFINFRIIDFFRC